MKHSISLISASVLLLMGQTVGAKPLPQLGKDSIQAVIAAMTDEEKIQLVMGTGMQVPGLPEDKQSPVVGEVDGKVPGAAGTTFAIPRLGIPSIVLADGPAGLRIQPQRPKDSATYYATAFPVGTALASTWNTDLVRQVGAAIGNEAKSYGVDVLLAPALNTQRNPLGGRGFEYFSEDPVVSGNMAAAYVNGVQSNGVGTSVKHFVLNDHETNRNVINVKVNEQPLRDLYLRGFQIAVRKGKPWTVMSSYNRINGTYASESHALLTDVLRHEWGFDGLVMSDWFGGSDAVAQLKAGNDLLMPGSKGQKKSLEAAISSGKINAHILDVNVARILRLVERSLSFKKYVYNNHPDLAAHAQLSRQAAGEGMVLLKNQQQALPFSMQVRRIALLGNAAYDTVKGGTGSGDVHVAGTVSIFDGLSQAGYTLNNDLKNRYTEYIASAKAKRPPLAHPLLLPPPIPELDLKAVDPQMLTRLAQDNDLAVITLGRNSGEFADRHLAGDYELTEVEKQLLRNVTDAFHAKGKKSVVVLNIGGVIETASWRDIPDAIVLAWLPGQEAGHAVADVLKGQVNPSGKLAVTFPARYTDLPSAVNFPGQVLIPKDPNNHDPLSGDQAAEIEYQDGMNLGYRYFDRAKVKVAYPFGFGLSYSRFTYGQPRVSMPKTGQSGVLDIDVDVRNSGAVAGKESVQIYLAAPKAASNTPVKELRAFAKTKLLRPGELQTLRIHLEPMDWASYNVSAARWVIPAGAYQIMVGASSQDIRGTASFEQKQEIVVQQVSPQLRPASPITEQ